MKCLLIHLQRISALVNFANPLAMHKHVSVAEIKKSLRFYDRRAGVFHAIHRLIRLHDQFLALALMLS